MLGGIANPKYNTLFPQSDLEDPKSLILIKDPESLMMILTPHHLF